MNTHLLVAKYVPDLQRMEPKNIGVIGWCEGAFETRFLGSSDCPVPAFLADDNYAFGEWKAVWQYHIEKESILNPKDGEKVRFDDVRFLDVLMQKSKTQFCLTRGAVVKAGKIELSDVMDEMFETLVLSPVRQKHPSEVKDRFIKLLERRDLSKLNRVDRTQDGEFNGVRKPFKVDFAFAAEKTALFQSIRPGHGNSANIAAFMFSGIRQANNNINCCSIYNGSELEKDGGTDLELVGSVSTLIDVSAPNEALRKIKYATGI